MAKRRVDEVGLAGQVLSNIAYNLAQDSRLPDDARALLDGARRRWDAAVMKAHEEKKARRARGGR
jgi:hypothetical protein